ncbi:MAG TPA: hypothetical protein VI958_07030, partial [Acidobacteriota bacterium]
HQEQLLKYAFDRGIELAVLTDGFTWRLYLPLSAGGWASRCFYVVDIRNQQTESTAEKLDTMLSRDSVDSGKALAQAKEVHESKERERTIKDTIPKAWSQMLSEPDELLIELLQEKVESLCGYRPEADVCRDLIVSRGIQFAPSVRRATESMSESSAFSDSGMIPTDSATERSTLTGTGIISFADFRSFPNLELRRIVRFTFRGVSRNSRYWWEVLVGVCEMISLEKGTLFADKVLSRFGMNRTGFSRRKSDLRLPREIPGTGIFVCVEFSANSHVKRTLQVMELLSYPPSDLTIEYELGSNNESDHANEYHDDASVNRLGIVEFVFLGTRHTANNRLDASRRLCAELVRLHPEKAHLFLSVRGRERLYFSRNKSELQKPRLIPGTDIYLNNILTTYEWQALEPRLLRLFGYKSSDYKVLET